MAAKKITVKDSHTLCPVNRTDFDLNLKSGTKVRIEGREYTVKGSNGYMLWFNEKFELPGVSKSTPKEISVELVGE